MRHALPLLALTLAACSAEAYRREADDEVYEILRSKRGPALGPDAPAIDFKVEAAPASVRSRLTDEIQHGQRPQLKLTLSQALEVAAENSRSFQDRKESLYQSALNLTGQRNRYGTIFGAGGDASVNGVSDDTVQGSTRASADASKILASGARVLGSFVNTFFRVFTSGGGWDTSSLLSLSVTQPLLAGFGAEVTLEPLTQAERNTIYAVRDYERFRRTFCVDIVTEYLSVLEQENNLKNEEENTKSLTDNKVRSQELGQAARMDKYQVDQAEQQELSAKDRLIQTRTRLETALDRLKITLGLPIEIGLQLDARVFDELKKLGLTTVELEEELTIRLALERRLDLRNQREQVEDADRQTRVAADALRMGLDLTAAIDVPNEDSSKPFKFDFENFEWQVGLLVDLPLNKVSERNVYRQSLLALDAERRALTLLEDNVKQAIRTAVRDVEAAVRQYQIQDNALTLATDRVKSMRMFLEAGRVEQRDFLDAQQSLLEAQNSVTSAMVDYVTAKLRLLRDLELLDVGETGLSLDLEAARDALRKMAENKTEGTEPPTERRG